MFYPEGDFLFFNLLFRNLEKKISFTCGKMQLYYMTESENLLWLL